MTKLISFLVSLDMQACVLVQLVVRELGSRFQTCVKLEFESS